MNIKKATNSQLSTTESKKTKTEKLKLSKQPEQEQNHRYVDHLGGYQLGRGRGRTGKRGKELRSTSW